MSLVHSHCKKALHYRTQLLTEIQLPKQQQYSSYIFSFLSQKYQPLTYHTSLLYIHAHCKTNKLLKCVQLVLLLLVGKIVNQLFSQQLFFSCNQNFESKKIFVVDVFTLMNTVILFNYKQCYILQFILHLLVLIQIQQKNLRT